MLVADDGESGGSDDLKLNTVMGQKVGYEEQSNSNCNWILTLLPQFDFFAVRAAYGENWRNSSRSLNIFRFLHDINDTMSHEARHSNDLIIAYVHRMSSGRGKAFPYQMHLGKTGVMIRHDGIFDKQLLAHEVGHVLGAGHEDYKWTGFSRYMNSRPNKSLQKRPSVYFQAFPCNVLCSSNQSGERPVHYHGNRYAMSLQPILFKSTFLHE